jgi:AhpD family alkylhydroperoxidase
MMRETTVERLKWARTAPKAYEALSGLERFLRDSPLPHSTLELLKLRASQINGCGFCVDMHSHDAKKAGETDERLFALAAWRDTPYFTEAERAALALAEAGTRLSDRPDPVPDEIWDEAAKHYDEEGLAALVAAIAAINAWNRISVITRPTPGAFR